MPDARRQDWAAAEMLEGLLTNDARLVGKTNILGVNLDGTAWRDAARERIKFLCQRHVLGPG